MHDACLTKHRDSLSFFLSLSFSTNVPYHRGFRPVANFSRSPRCTQPAPSGVLENVTILFSVCEFLGQCCLALSSSPVHIGRRRVRATENSASFVAAVSSRRVESSQATNGDVRSTASVATQKIRSTRRSADLRTRCSVERILFRPRRVRENHDDYVRRQLRRKRTAIDRIFAEFT